MDLSQVTLDDGRQVDVATAGAPDGAAVLLQHGLPLCRLMAAHADEDARQCGVRVLSLSRPGFGQSSAAKPSLAERGDDAVEVAGKLGADRFAVLGVSFGAPCAAATAVRGGEKVTALGIAVGIGPWELLEAEPDGVDPAEEEILVRLDADGDLDAAVAAYRDLGRAWFDELLAHEGDEELMQAFDAMTEPPEGRDPEALAWMTPQMRVRFARDVREALTTYDGLALDNLTVARGWDIDQTSVRQPTFLWYGGADTMTALDHARWWTSQIPQAALTVRDGQDHGQAYLVHWREMLEQLGSTVR